MASLLLPSVERLDDPKSMFRVDAEQFQQHEADRAAFVRRPILHRSPQVRVDVRQSVFAHRDGSVQNIRGLWVGEITAPTQRPHRERVS